MSSGGSSKDDSSENSRSDTQANPLLLMCLGFGLLGGLIFPLYASIFMGLAEMSHAGFLVGCVVGGLAFGGSFYAVLTSMIRTNLRKVEQVVDAVASGDLSVRCAISTNNMVASIAQSVNKMTVGLHSSITQIAKSTDQVSAAVNSMAKQSQDRKNSISSQPSASKPSASKKIAAAKTEMAASAKKAASVNKDVTATAAQTTNNTAKSGSQLTSKTMTGIQSLAGEVEKAGSVIQKLEEDSQSIGVILEVIQGIAEQTNLLALNAAIEAARSGEQGRGFAVVADEVRTLASRTQQSTEEIKRMIDKLQTGASDAVKVMETARTTAQKSKLSVPKTATGTLSGKEDAVSTIDESNTPIADASVKQASMANEVSQNINNINDVAVKAKTGVETSKKSGVEIQELVSQLASEVSKFKR